MPNNKKNRKNKEKKAARTAASSTTTTTVAAAAAAAAVARPSACFHCPHNPVACNKCVFAYPVGCLHTLRENERNSPEMNEIMAAFLEFIACGYNYVEMKEWERPEFAPFVNKGMVRYILHAAIKIILNKESLEKIQDDIYESLATSYLYLAVQMYGSIKCGSHNATLSLESDESKSFSRLVSTLRFMLEKDYYNAVYCLNELSPCGCLEEELERTQADRRPLCCSNQQCGEKEDADSDRWFNCCAKCKMTVYCCRNCQVNHWQASETGVRGTTPRKKACKEYREFVSFVRGNDDDNKSAL